MWTPYVLHGAAFRGSDGTGECPQVYETGKFRSGGQGGNRTPDASLFRAALYQLSYLAKEELVYQIRLYFRALSFAALAAGCLYVFGMPR